MRKSKPRQLSFVFADSPQGAGRAEKVDVSTQPTQPVHKANDNDHSATAPPRGGPFSGYRPEEPDVRSTSPVLWEPRGGNSPRLPDMAVGRELALPGDQIPRLLRADVLDGCTDQLVCAPHLHSPHSPRFPICLRKSSSARPYNMRTASALERSIKLAT